MWFGIADHACSIDSRKLRLLVHAILILQPGVIRFVDGLMLLTNCPREISFMIAQTLGFYAVSFSLFCGDFKSRQGAPVISKPSTVMGDLRVRMLGMPKEIVRSTIRRFSGAAWIC